MLSAQPKSGLHILEKKNGQVTKGSRKRHTASHVMLTIFASIVHGHYHQLSMITFSRSGHAHVVLGHKVA